MKLVDHSYRSMPCFVPENDNGLGPFGYYGLPMIDVPGIKCSAHYEGPVIDPDRRPLSAGGRQAGAVDELAAHGIRINSVSPGMTNTELVADVVPTFDFSKIPLGRIGEPEEIAEGVAFLLGETGSYCSGANIRIAGGRPPGTFLG